MSVINSKEIENWEKLTLFSFHFDKVLGLNLFEFEEISSETKSKLEEIIQKRNSAKASKDFKLADSLRDEAKALGFELEDTKEGTVYKLL